MERPKVLSSKRIFSGYVDLEQDLLLAKNGQEITYTYLVLKRDATVILAQDEEGHFILNREYRHPTKLHTLGCPGGTLEEGEDPLAGAIREFEEETGYSSREFQQMGVSYPFPGLCNQKIYYFFAENAFLKKSQKLDPLECIQTVLLPEPELMEKIKTGEGIDGLLVTALGYWQLNGKLYK